MKEFKGRSRSRSIRSFVGKIAAAKSAFVALDPSNNPSESFDKSLAICPLIIALLGTATKVGRLQPRLFRPYRVR
jgi:hypothetical protein